jgi:uncharacterized membrane protein
MQVNERRIYQVFRTGVILKALHAAIEIAGGLFFCFVSVETLRRWIEWLARQELTAHPHDALTPHLLAAAQHLSGASASFYAFYLLSHGLVKAALAAGLLREKLVAYPASLVALVGFIGYQVWNFSQTHSLAMVLLTVFDLAVLALIWHEWQLLRRHLPTH